MRNGIGLAVTAVLLLSGAGPCRAGLCSDCTGKMYIQSVGTCAECGGHTASGAFKLCKACSEKLGQCQHCRALLAGATGQAHAAMQAEARPAAQDTHGRSGTESGGGRFVSLAIRPAKAGKAFAFGKVAAATFTLKNLSDRAIVVHTIRPITNGRAEPIHLSGSVYGSIAHDADGEAYRHDTLTQRQTRQPFHVGFLLPGQQIHLACDYRPLFARERFAVHYLPAAAKYDGSPASLRPFKVYVLQESRSDPLKAAYAPFDEARWRAICKAAAGAAPPGPGTCQRAVLIPVFSAQAAAEVLEVPIAFQGKAFSGEQALATAAKVAKTDPSQIRLAYSDALGGYLVITDTGRWLLTDPGQTEPGESLPAATPQLLHDIDAYAGVRVRAGDKQVGPPDPTTRQASWRFWGTYQVEYGDGMYTRGEFIHIDKANLLPFLRTASGKGLRLAPVRYYFRSRYFVLQPAKPQPPAGSEPSAPAAAE